MFLSPMMRLAMAGVVLTLGACAEREPPPPPAGTPVAPQVVETLPPPPDTLRGDSIMARDTARIPQ